MAHAHTADDVQHYLGEIGRSARLANWQYQQVVAALEILFGDVLHIPWAATFDWGYWRDSARRLEARHATIARDTPEPEQAATDTAKARRLSPNQALLKSVRNELRRRAYSVRTEQTYLHWIRRFIASFGNRDPQQLCVAEVKVFLERLAVHNKVASSTQNQALSALIFLYREVLHSPMELGQFVRAKRPRHLPVVLTRHEVHALLDELTVHEDSWPASFTGRACA